MKTGTGKPLEEVVIINQLVSDESIALERLFLSCSVFGPITLFKIIENTSASLIFFLQICRIRN